MKQETIAMSPMYCTVLKPLRHFQLVQRHNAHIAETKTATPRSVCQSGYHRSADKRTAQQSGIASGKDAG